MESNEVKRAIKLALTENPDKRITPKELEDAMIKTVDYVDETKASLEKYVDEKLANVPDVPETPETPETPDVPGCECEPVEKKEPYVIVVENISNVTTINNEEEVNKVREALTDGSGVLVKFTDDIQVGELLVGRYDTKEDNSLYATRRINGRKYTIACEWDFKINVHSYQVTFRCDLVYFNFSYGNTASGYVSLEMLLHNIYSSKAKGRIYGPVSINGEVNSYNIIIDNVRTGGNNTYLSGKIVHLDYGRNVTLTINDKGKTSAIVDLPYTENPVKKEELYFNDGSGKVVPIRHPDLSTQPSILPYKFAGNYVYEQMFYISGPVNADAHFVTIPFTADELSAGELPVIIDCNISAELSWNSGTVKYTKHVTKCDTTILFDESRGHTLNLEFLREAEDWADGGLVFVNAWVRLVWAKKPDTSGGDDYYYQQQQQGDGVPGINIINYVEKDVVAVFYSKIDGYTFRLEPLSFRDRLLLTGQELTGFINGEYFITFHSPNDTKPEKGADFRLSVDGSGEHLTGGTVTENDGDQIHNAIDIYRLQSSCPKAYDTLMKGNTIYFTLYYIAI